MKRSPLEFGFVTFPEIEKPDLNKKHSGVNAEKNGVHILTSTTSRSSHTHEWIPGEILHELLTNAKLALCIYSC